MSDKLPPRPFGELSDSGLLWLINRAVFHPRGYALSLVVQGGELAGWQLLGDGSEPWFFGGDEDAKFAAVQATFAAAQQEGLGGPCGHARTADVPATGLGGDTTALRCLDCGQWVPDQEGAGRG